VGDPAVIFPVLLHDGQPGILLLRKSVFDGSPSREYGTTGSDPRFFPDGVLHRRHGVSSSANLTNFVLGEKEIFILFK
jgi:hypothetical protein